MIDINLGWPQIYEVNNGRHFLAMSTRMNNFWQFTFHANFDSAFIIFGRLFGDPNVNKSLQCAFK